MAGTIKGITVSIGGDTGPLDKALQGVNKTSRDLQTELNSVNKLLKLDPTNTILLAQKQKLLAESVSTTKGKLDTLKEAEKQAQAQFAEGKISEEQYRKLQQEVVTTEQKIKSLNGQVKEQTNNFNGLSDKINSKVNGALKGIAVGIGAAVVGLGALVMKSAESADAIQTTAEVYGLTAERVQELTYVGTKLDVELDTITKSQQFLTRNMLLAEKGTGAQADAFKALGISVVDSNGNLRDGKTVMDETITALGKMPNATERDALAMKVFGKSAMELNPLIKAGGDEIARLTDEAHKSGAVMSNETVEGLDSFGDSAEALKLSLQGAIGSALTPLVPKLQEMADKLKNIDTKPLTEGLKWVINNGGLIVGVISGVVGLLVAYKVAWALSNIPLMINNLELVKNTIASAASAVAHGIATAAIGIATAAQWLFNAAMTANPIGLLIVGIVALVAGLGLLAYAYGDASRAAADATKITTAENKKQGEAERAQITETADAKKKQVADKTAIEDKYYSEQTALLQKQYDEDVKNSQKSLDVLKKNLAERQKSLDDNYKNAISNIQDEYGVFEEKEKSKTQILQDDYTATTALITDIGNLAQAAATAEGKAFTDTSAAILAKAQDTHDAKMIMYTQEYLASLGIINDNLNAEVSGYQGQIDALNAKTTEEDRIAKEQADAQTLLDLRQKGDNEALQTEINRQNREKLLEQRQNDIISLNTKITDAVAKANEEKGKLYAVLQDKIANEQLLIKSNTDYNIAQIQAERIAKEAAETAKYNATKKALDSESAALDGWLENYKIKLDTKLAADQATETARHDTIMINLKAESDAIAAGEKASLAASLVNEQAKNASDEIINLQNQIAAVQTKDWVHKDFILDPMKINDLNKGIDAQKKILHGLGIPGYASGTSFATPGLRWVGENGPELLRFRGGESVLNARDSANSGGGTMPQNTGDMVFNFDMGGGQVKTIKLTSQQIAEAQRQRNSFKVVTA